MTKLTDAQFSMQCSFIARCAADWAACLLTLPEDYNREAKPSSVKRFTDQMRERLDLLDKWAAREAVAAPHLEPVIDDGDDEACVVCDAHLEDGDDVYWSVNDDGHMHAECAATFVGDDGKETEEAPKPFSFRSSRPRKLDNQNYNCPCAHPSQCDESCFARKDNLQGVDIPRLPVGTPVNKDSGYPFPGIVVSAFHTLSGQERFVVEATGEAYAGLLHIYNGGQLRVITGGRDDV